MVKLGIGRVAIASAIHRHCGRAPSSKETLQCAVSSTGFVGTSAGPRPPNTPCSSSLSPRPSQSAQTCSAVVLTPCSPTLEMRSRPYSLLSSRSLPLEYCLVWWLATGRLVSDLPPNHNFRQQPAPADDGLLLAIGTPSMVV